MNGRKCARRQHGPLYALLSVFLDEDVEVGKVAELRLVHGRLRADRQRLSNLGNHHTDLPCGHLYPGMFRHRVDQPQLEAQSGHEHLGLKSCFAAERERVVARQFGAKPFSDQSDLGGTDAVD